jgi:hypothetical protein
MTPVEQHLRVLELDRGASHDAIKESYRRLVKVWHPDRFSHDADLRVFAEKRCKELNVAYEFLLSVPPERIQEKTARKSPPLPSIQIKDVQYRGSVVAQTVTELPRRIADTRWMERFHAIGKQQDIEFRVGNKPGAASGIQLAMVFDSEKRVVSFPSTELIQVDFPMFAAATICVRDFTFKGNWFETVAKGFRFCGWDGTAAPPNPNYFEAEYRLCKKVAELDIARVVARDSRLMEDLRVWFRPKDLTDVARWITNRVNYGTR